SVSAAIAFSRDSSLNAVGTASSRSRKTRSAPHDSALANMLSLTAGTASSERRSSDVMVGGPLRSQHARDVQIVDLGCGQTQKLAVHLGIVLPQRRAEMLDPAA